jgi:SAM-dependent methyltransferase
MLADERGGPILDLGCGTGRLLLPLVRDGHTVVGVDRAPAMLTRAASRIARLPAHLRRRALLVRGDLRSLAFPPRFAFAVAAFHSIQHLATDDDLVRFFQGVAHALIPGGWLAFDAFAPDARFLARGATERWGRTRFRHPVTGQTTIYSESHRRRGRVLAMTFHYQPIDARGRRRGPERRVRLEHRLLERDELPPLLARAGLSLIATWGGFDGRPLDGDTEQHIYLARHGAPPARPTAPGRPS